MPIFFTWWAPREVVLPLRRLIHLEEPGETRHFIARDLLLSFRDFDELPDVLLLHIQLGEFGFVRRRELSGTFVLKVELAYVQFDE